MVFLWFSYGFPIKPSIFLWFSYGFPGRVTIRTFSMAPWLPWLPTATWVQLATGSSAASSMEPRWTGDVKGENPRGTTDLVLEDMGLSENVGLIFPMT